MNKTAVIAGATGLVGESLVEQLIKDDYYQKLVVITRRPLTIENLKIETVLVPDFKQLSSHADKIKGDDVFCCLGTIMAKAKSKDVFRKIDYDYVVKIAEITKQNNASQFILISSLGADKNSRIFYNKVKGEVEETIQKMSFDETHILRPSMLLGPRQEKRAGEDAAKTLFKTFDFLFRGPLKKYKGIQADQVARAMLFFAKEENPGIHIHENKELLTK